jgi:ParB-like chromosome segregation protein Spo0J
MKLIPDPANPNRMSAEDKARMVKSLAEFGDLSGIVINRRTGMLVGGHQRADVLRDGELHVEDLTQLEVRTLAEDRGRAVITTQQPDDGTVARGWLDHGGKRYAVRVVDWPEEKARAALLAANRFGRVGQDDPAVLKDLLEALDTGATDMDLTGYSEAAIEELMTQFRVLEDTTQPSVTTCPKCGHQFHA